MPAPDESPSAAIERLCAQLEEIQRGADRTIASDNALAHAKACEDWIALHQQRVVERARFDRANR